MSGHGGELTTEARHDRSTITEPLLLDVARYAALTDRELDRLTDAQSIGHALFNALVRGEIRDLYNRARAATVQTAAAGLRIRLHFDPRDAGARQLMRVPWELLFDPYEGIGSFLALDPRTPVVRTIDTTAMVVPPASGTPENVLVVAASPSDQPVLEVEREAARLEEQLKRQRRRVVTLRHARRDTLIERVRQQSFQIVHVMGHGSFDRDSAEGVLWLEDHDGRGDPITARAFAELFRGIRVPRLVCLAACQSGDPGRWPAAQPFGSVAMALAGAGVPNVVAMQTPVMDDSAQSFTEKLYLHASDLSLEAAVSEARIVVRGKWPDTADWAVPVMFMREGVEQIEAAKPADPPPRESHGPITNIDRVTTTGGVTIIGSTFGDFHNNSRSKE